MIEIFVLIFLCKKIGLMAAERGLKSGLWKFFTVIAWVGFEFVGLILGAALFGSPHNLNDLVALMLFCLVCAFGGYLFIRYILEKKEIINHS